MNDISLVISVSAGGLMAILCVCCCLCLCGINVEKHYIREQRSELIISNVTSSH